MQNSAMRDNHQNIFFSLNYGLISHGKEYEDIKLLKIIQRPF